MRLWLACCLVLLAVLVCALDPFDDQPRIIVENGHLVIQAASNRNITFQSRGGGKIRINDADLQQLVETVQASVTEMEQFKSVDLGSFASQLQQLQERAEGQHNLAQLYLDLEQRVNNFTDRRLNPSRIPTARFSRLSRKVRQLERRLRTVTDLLKANECVSNPCQHGGTCEDNYNGFTCNCPPNWMGTLCESDINECAFLAGTDLGCQHGGSCHNTDGGYRCECPPNWYGVHCTEQHDDCSTASHEALCGHGTCINKQRAQTGQPRFDCLCDQGWTKRLGFSSCDEDVDECSGQQRYPCSQNPPVQCINLPGTVHCGPCPAGYTGDGFRCTDVNECEVNNGGCSLAPRVDCRNTLGSRNCGPCPAGYVGDGVRCSYVGACQANNGGCHPLASCVENSAVSPGYRECRCPAGTAGNGVGPNGCQSGTPCDGHPCAHGACTVSGASVMCLCYAGYSGALCDQAVDACGSANPCLNGGSCISRSAGQGFVCSCPSQWEGTTCQLPKESCGGRQNVEVGEINFPAVSDQYQPRQDCGWIITTTVGKVLSVTFESFHLESSPRCSVDFLQLNDGDSAAAHLLGRYCGDAVPNPVLTTHHQLYLWFHSDHGLQSNGFKIKWNTTDPVCGGALTEAEFGNINSPGYPGRYPINRDCYWTVKVAPGKRIMFNMATLNIEQHPNCSFDYLQIRDGLRETDPELATYCSTTSPRPVETSGSHAWLHFHTDDSVNDQGFHLTYSSVPGVPGCGGLLAGDRGALVSPNFPDPYQNQMSCDWLIRVHPQERIQLDFTEFHLELHSSCEWDYVEVYDGENEESLLIGRFCGEVFPPPILSSGNKLWVKFRSDTSNRAKGFKANYLTACGGLYSGTSGILRSPFYPDPYPSERTCSYQVVVPQGQVINLQFMDFNIEDHHDGECTFDYLQITDNGSPNGTVLARLCGTGMPELVTSSYNQMLLTFVSDGSVQNRGFLANYSTIDIGCGGVLTDSHGVVATPLHPTHYPPSTTCNWIVRAPPGFSVRLTFTTFVLEESSQCQFDFVLVKDGDGQFQRRFCGNRIPPPVTSSGSELFITFRTDSSVAREGFQATYQFLDLSTVCGGNIIAEYGTIRSPRFPQDYPPNRDCTWILHAQMGHQIRVNVTHFKLESHTNCKFDYLEIRNGATASSPLVGKFCGQNILSEITSHSNTLFLHFRSDYSLTEAGFQLQFDASTTGCGGFLTTPSGSVVSPNYPDPYSHNSECVWRIQVAMGSLVSFVIIDVDIESHASCRFDYIKVFDGATEQAPVLSNRCSGQQNPGPLTSTGNQITIKFASDSSQSGRGFHLSYHTKCNTVLQLAQGAIESPNFPELYPHNFNCTWTILAPLGNNVSLTFSHLLLEEEGDCLHDYVQIQMLPRITYHGPNSSPRRPETLAKYCGNQTRLPLPLEVPSNEVLISFISDGSVASDGFRLEYAVKGCGGILNKPWGQISSPNYPYGYPTLTTCEWQIEQPAGQGVFLLIRQVDLEGHTECRFDYIKVYGGATRDAPLLQTICHKSNEDITIKTESSRMLVVFHSDVSLGGKGFQGNYHGWPARCGGDMRSDHGLIVSTEYPKSFGKTLQCTWQIQVGQNHLLQLTFEEFQLPVDDNCTQNFVRVYDSMSSATPLFESCQSATSVSDVITASGNAVTLRIAVNAVDQDVKAFKLSFKEVCEASIEVTSRGELTSPGYPHRSNNFYNCSWVLHTPEPDGHVTLTLTNLMTAVSENCSMAYLEVRDGSSADSPLINRFCGQRLPPPIVSLGASLRVHVQHMTIFRATYSSSTSACGGDLEAVEGTLNSPAFPDSYPPATECIWTITPSSGNRVQFSFSFFEIESDEFCSTDFVEVREGGSDGPLLGRYCGLGVPNNASSGPVESLWILFRSDEEGTARGFQANYLLEHGVNLEGTSGFIASPLFPNPSYLVGEFTWTIDVPLDFFVSLRFTLIEMEYYGDECQGFVQIFDGADATFPSLGRFCGHRPPDEVLTHSNQAFVLFHTERMTGSRWFLDWTAVNDSYIASRNNTATGIPYEFCGEELNVSIGHLAVVTSPNHPNDYRDLQNCTWLLVAPPSRHVELSFEPINIEGYGDCVVDYLSIYNGLDAIGDSWDLNQTVCGRRDNLTVIGTSSRMKLNFVTDSSVTLSGFAANVTEECGNKLSGPSGVIRTTDALVTNTTRTDLCIWHITVKPGRTIKITFDSFNVNSDGVCSTQYLQILNGGSRDSPFLGEAKYCGQNIPAPLESSSFQVLIIVKTKTIRSFEDTEVTPEFVLRYEEMSLGCGGQLFLRRDNPSVTLTSPGYPRPPPHDVECIWVIMSPPATSIRFDVDQLLLNQTQCYEWGPQTDFLALYDGGTEQSPKLDHICNNNTNSRHSSGNILLVRLVVGHDNLHTLFRGNLTISKCGGIISSHSPEISSPGFPGNYENDLECEWFFRYRQYSWTGQILSMNIQNTTNCTADYLEIREKDKQGELVGRYCGDSPVIDIPPSGNPNLYVKFKSDSSSSATGFKMELGVYYSRQRCGGHLEGESGSLGTPNFPESVSNPMWCQWQIDAPPGRSVTLRFNHFNIPQDPVTGYCVQGLSVYEALERSVQDQKLCGSQPPVAVLNSVGKTLYIQLNIRYLAAGEGFQAEYTTDKEVFCGGDLPLPSGQLALPTVDSLTTTSRIRCPWQIKNPEGRTNGTFVLEMKDLVLSNASDNCRPATLYIYSRNYINNAYWDKNFCGNYSGSTIRFFSNELSAAILLTVNKQIENVRFNASYHLNECGGSLRAPTSFSSPDFPRSYPSGLICVWLITVDQSEQLNVTVVDIALAEDCSTDFLLIRNGPEPDAPVMAKYCNGVSPVAPRNMLSMDNKILVEFHTGPSNTERGFNISVQSNSRGCGGMYHRMREQISSPGYSEGRYPSSVECQWQIVLPEEYSVNMTFQSRFDIQESVDCTKDFLLVEERWQNSWRHLSRFCGHRTPLSLVSNTSEVRMTFRSDEKTSADGFMLRYTPACGSVLSSSEGVVTSPGFPNSYLDSLECYFQLRSPTGQRDYLSLQFQNFTLEQGPANCYYDSVTIYEGNITNRGQNYGTFCGTNTPPDIQALGSLLIVFKTDGSGRYPGFRATYGVSGCGGVLEKSSGSFRSPHYPMNYPANVRCVWNINIPEDMVIELKFLTFDLEGGSCSWDWVEIWDGPERVSPSLGSFCGTTLPGIYKSSGNNMTVVFRTDSSQEGAGFKAAYRTTLGEKKGCGGLLQVPTNAIPSPDYDGDGNYETDLDCIWRVVGDPGKVMDLSFFVFALEEGNGTMCPYDFVEVLDGLTDSAPLVGRFCGTTTPANFRTSSNMFWLHFHSDSANTDTGFQLDFTSVEPLCGGQLGVSNETATLTSPNYPNALPAGLRCRWTFDLNRTTDRIELTFSHMDIPCGGNYLDIFQHLLVPTYQRASNTPHRLCGQQTFKEVLSTSSVSLLLVTDPAAPAGTGFSIQYRLANCSRQYVQDNGMIFSPSFPLASSSESLCNVSILAAEGHTISLYFLMFRSSLYTDYDERGYVSRQSCRTQLKVFDGGNSSAPNLRSICGYDAVDPVFSSSNQLFLQLNRTAGDIISYVIVYTTTDKGPGCGGNLLGANGTFTSPLYPLPYNISATCSWLLAVPGEHTLTLSLSGLMLTSESACESNYVEIFEGPLDTPRNKVARYCGGEFPAPHSSQGNQVLVKLVTDETNVGHGFRAVFQANDISITKARSVVTYLAAPTDAPPTSPGVLELN